MMFGFLLDVASAVIGAVVPIYRTWKVLKSRKTTQLVPLAKYWVVFGVVSIVEIVADALYIPYLFPSYSLLRFAAITYISISGYVHIYDSVISPFLTEQEPFFGRFLTNMAQYSGQLAGSCFREIVQYVLLAMAENNGPNYAGYTAMFASASTRPAAVARESFLEVQEECEIVYPLDVKPEIFHEELFMETSVCDTADERLSTMSGEQSFANAGGDSHSSPPKAKLKKQPVRRSSRVFKNKK